MWRQIRVRSLVLCGLMHIIRDESMREVSLVQPHRFAQTFPDNILGRIQGRVRIFYRLFSGDDSFHLRHIVLYLYYRYLRCTYWLITIALPIRMLCECHGSTGGIYPSAFCSFTVIFLFVKIKDLQILIKVANFIDDVYKQSTSSPQTGKYRKYADKSVYIVKFSVASSFAWSSVYMLFPAVVCIITGSRFSQLRLLAPWNNENTTNGFIIVNMFNFSIIIRTIYEIYPIDILTINILVNIPMVSASIVSYLNELQSDLQERRLNLRMARVQLMSFIRMHSRYNE